MNTHRQLFDEIVALEIRLWTHLDAGVKKRTGISLAQLQALEAISSRRDGARVQDVSDDLQITVGAASKLIDRLERDRLALRAPNPGDRRSMVITLTPAGTEGCSAAAAAADELLPAILGSGVDERMVGDLAQRLSSLRRGLKEAGE
jgi:DNA-binding MarR family transcriptional regulator